MRPIFGLKAAGKEFRQIGREIGRSEHVVRNFLKNPTLYGTAKSPGRPKSLTPRDERRVGRVFSNSQLSLRSAKNELGLQASIWSIHRALKRNPYIKYTKMQPAPKLTKRHKGLRLQYAHKYMSWKNEWKQV
jgi:hypothetical protein